MTAQKVKFRYSLVSRFALFFTGLNITAILIVGYLVYDQAASVIITHSQDRMRYTSNLAIKSFNSLLSEVANDIAVTTNNPVVGHYFKGTGELRIDDLKALFSAVLIHKPSYYQIRLLDVNNQGREMLRFDKVENQIVQIPEDKLQFKGDRLYYQEALKINKGSYYYSDINLNEEFGKVSIPYTPTLRAVGQILDDQDKMTALLVINVDLSAFYEELHQVMGPEYHLLMVGNNGDYLFSRDMGKCFGSQLRSGISFNVDFEKDIKTLLNEQQFGFIKNKSGTNFLYRLEAINYSPGQEIYLVNMQEDNLLFRSAYLVRNDSLKRVLLVCLISLILAFLFARIFSRDITKITKAVGSYDELADPLHPVSLPENRKDELGLLARTFSRMSRHINQQLSDLKAALGREKQAIRDRDQFLQNMSHELRTPLNAILGLSRLLAKNQPSQAQLPIIESLRRSARNLTGLLHDVLDHQKLKEGKIHLNLCSENYFSLMSDIYAAYRYEAINKGLIFSLEVTDTLKQTNYLTDPLRFNQIITNLVVNAIKFTDVGTVALKASETKEEPHMLKVEVIDSGRGIKPENLKKIKDRFYQVKEKATAGDGGYGLGLSIVKQLVDLFGGRLEVTSKLGTGSIFSVLLPLIPADTPEKKKSGSKFGDPPLPELKDSYRVLHIEDDASTKVMIDHFLDLPCVSLEQVSSTEEAEKVMESGPPDLILSDLLLKLQPIDTFLLQIRDTGIPLVILSAFNPSRMKPISPYYLQKPFEQTDLVNMVYMLLGQTAYDVPFLEKIYRQYDHQPEKIRNFLSIVQAEFNSYVDRFDKVYESRDVAEWEAILHKLETHIKSLKLQKLAQSIPAAVSELDENSYKSIRNGLLYCLCVFRYESGVRHMTEVTT